MRALEKAKEQFIKIGESYGLDIPNLVLYLANGITPRQRARSSMFDDDQFDDMIINALTDSDHPMSGKEVSERLGVTYDSSFLLRMSALSECGLIFHNGKKSSSLYTTKASKFVKNARKQFEFEYKEEKEETKPEPQPQPQPEEKPSSSHEMVLFTLREYGPMTKKEVEEMVFEEFQVRYSHFTIRDILGKLRKENKVFYSKGIWYFQEQTQ